MKYDREQLGNQHPSTAASINNMAGLLEYQERYDEAEPLYVKALDILVGAFGEQHPNSATTMNNLGLFLCIAENAIVKQSLFI